MGTCHDFGAPILPSHYENPARAPFFEFYSVGNLNIMYISGAGLDWVTDVGTCGSAAAPLYFVAFQLVGTFVLLNIVIAVVLENFSVSKFTGEKEVCPLTNRS